MGEDSEDELEVRHPVRTDGPQSEEYTIAGSLQWSCQRPAVQLPPVVRHRHTLVNLHVSLVAHERRRHFVVRPANVDLNATIASITLRFAAIIDTLYLFICLLVEH